MKPASKVQYSEHEAAAVLGVTVEELRALVLRHIVKDYDMPSASVPAYHPSDLVLLRMLTRMNRAPEPLHA